MHHWLILLLSGWLLTGAIIPPEIHHTTETQSARIENQTTIGPDEFPPGVNPLTGLPVDDPGVLARHPFVVKISNAPPLVRPQAGIGAADLVFEHYAEGGLTRFSAIFYSQAPQRVGSIRSARLIDYELLPMYQGLLAFSGASIGVEDRLNTSEFANQLYKGVLYGFPHYWRDENIPVPHNMFTNLAALWDLEAANGEARPPDFHSMVFDPVPPANSAGQTNVIDIRYRATRVGWEYDADTGMYQRFADGQAHFDANSNEQISAANVFVLYADHDFTDIVESEWQGSISYSIEIKLWFEGDGVLFRDGQRYDARWLRPTRQDMIGLRTTDGAFLPFKPGNTWFQVMRPPEQQTPEEEWLRME
jgi:hypothetical protein